MKLRYLLLGLFASSFLFVSVSFGQALPGRVINLSVRMRSGPASSTAIVGFNIPPGSNKTVLIRGAGPSLVNFGVPAGGIMVDPVLTLYNSSRQSIFTNDNWETQPGIPDPQYRISVVGVTTACGGFPLMSGGKDAAILTTLSPGNYTAQVTAKDSNVANAYGVLIFEEYEANDPVNKQSGPLTNVSGRGFVGQGTDVMIIGIVIDNAPVKALIRGAGPSLAQFGVDSVLADPVITLRNGQGQILDPSGTFVPKDSTAVTNDDWSSNATVASAAAKVGAFDFAANSKDAAAVVTLSPGSYTITISGKTGTGNAIGELYIIQ